MGVLIKAKNGDERFWNIEISCSQWEGSACTHSALIFFLLSFVWVGEGFFFIFPLFPTCSLQVPNGFPHAPIGFPKFSMCSSIYPPNSTSHYPRCFALSSTFITSPKVGYHNISILELCKAWFFFKKFQWANHRCPSYILWGSWKWINTNHRVCNQKWWPSF
jgi:hypothetical protein